MTPANEPNDRDEQIERHLRGFSRRVDRLEYTQISPQEFSRSFDRVYDEIDALEDVVNQRFDRLEGEVRELNRKFDELDRKFNIVMQHITGEGRS
jgi:predicted nuclease with TOPRIM domain